MIATDAAVFAGLEVSYIDLGDKWCGGHTASILAYISPHLPYISPRQVRRTHRLHPRRRSKLLSRRPGHHQTRTQCTAHAVRFSSAHC